MNSTMKYVGVIGERKTSKELQELAVKVGGLIAAEGWILVCGGMGGIMEASCKGAIDNNGTTIGIIPGINRDGANQFLSYSVVTGFFEARNSIVVRSCDAIIAIGGSYGTLSEIGFANVYGIPLVGLKSWEAKNDNLSIYDAVVDTPEEAVEKIKKLLETK